MDPALVHGLTTHRASSFFFCFGLCLPRFVLLEDSAPGGLPRPDSSFRKTLLLLFFALTCSLWKTLHPEGFTIRLTHQWPCCAGAPPCIFVFCCFVGKGRKEVSSDYQYRKDFFVKILGEMQLRFHLGQANKRNESGNEVRKFHLLPQSLQSPASPHRRHRSPRRPDDQARPGAMLDRGTRTKDRPKSAKFNDQKECFLFILCSAMPSQVVSSNLKEGRSPNGMRGSKSL